MVIFESDFTDIELIKRWDEHTSISRFAGNDETLDLIFVSKRKGNKVRLVRKAASAREPFASVFRGTIKKTEQGSKIVGYFTKSILDYVFIALVFSVLFYMRYCIINRGESLKTINGLLVIAVVGSILCLYNYRSAKRKFADFISRITGRTNKWFLTKTEKKNNEN